MSSGSDRVTPRSSGERLRIGVSACLLGQPLRYNGGHLADGFLLSTLAPFAEWVPVCPEVEVGMGTPREPVLLVGEAGAERMVGVATATDHTERMRAWAAGRAAGLAAEHLDGYVLAKDSPSCGMERVKRYPAGEGPAVRDGVGLFAAALMAAHPGLPVEENGRLNDSRLRENFIERTFVRRRWRAMLAEDPTPRGLVAFHTAHKLTFMAHSPRHYREAGRLVAQAGSMPWEALVAAYVPLMAEGLRLIATARKHANVLQHLMGYLKRALDAADKAELLEAVEAYRLGRVPLVVPLTLLNHHLRRNPVPEWVHRQVYLHPYPAELALRNHV
jgi:uncharacterized protein YbgA (DUF1722 family)/uncharacterized protein YbbK (DUF523 family)